ncbi:MAG TPA: DoxX family protein [Burkholderiales bacterium]
MNHLVGRILLALVFLVAGVRKLMAPAASAGYLAKLGFPAPEVMVWVAIAFELGGAILLILGWKTRWGALALALFTLIATFAAHRFWEFDAAQYANQMNHFLKNLAIVGGMVLLAATGPGPLSVDGRRRGG